MPAEIPCSKPQGVQIGHLPSVRAAHLRALRRRRVPEGAACIICGISNPALLRHVGGRSIIDFNHIPGEAIDPELGAWFCLNHHAVWTAWQHERGLDLRHGVERSAAEHDRIALSEFAAFLRFWANGEGANDCHDREAADGDDCEAEDCDDGDGGYVLEVVARILPWFRGWNALSLSETLELCDIERKAQELVAKVETFNRPQYRAENQRTRGENRNV